MWPRSSQAVQHSESNGSWQQGLLALEEPENRFYLSVLEFEKPLSSIQSINKACIAFNVIQAPGN